MSDLFTVDYGDDFGVDVGLMPSTDAPSNAVPGPLTTEEDSPLALSASNGNGVSITADEVGTSDVQVSLTVTNGVLSLSGTSGLTFTTGDGTDDATWCFQALWRRSMRPLTE